MEIKKELVELIYDVPLGVSSWESVVQELKKEFNATLGFMLIERPKQVPIVISTIPNDHAIWQSYGEYYHSIDPWVAILDSGKLPHNTCTAGNLHMRDRDYYKTEYFNDFWKPHSLYHTSGGRLFTRNNISMVLGFPRDKTAGSYRADETLMMTFYGRQIVRAVELEGVFGISLPQPIYAQALSASYGLTDAESRLVLELFKTGSLPEVSRSLHRSYHTVRNQMRSILKKTETANQIELFRLLFTNESSIQLVK